MGSFPTIDLRNESDVVLATTEIHPKIERYLSALLETGLYGHNRADVILRLVERCIRDAIAGGIINQEE